MKLSLMMTTLILTFALGCAHHNKPVTVAPEVGVKENEAGGVTARVLWMKNKPKSVDFELALVNSYKEPIVIKDNSFTLEYQGQKFPIKSAKGSTVLNTDVKYEKVLVFALSKIDHRQGEVTLTIDPIQSENDAKNMKPIKFVLPLSPN